MSEKEIEIEECQIWASVKDVMKRSDFNLERSYDTVTMQKFGIDINNPQVSEVLSCARMNLIMHGPEYFRSGQLRQPNKQ